MESENPGLRFGGGERPLYDFEIADIEQSMPHMSDEEFEESAKLLSLIVAPETDDTQRDSIRTAVTGEAERRHIEFETDGKAEVEEMAAGVLRIRNPHKWFGTDFPESVLFETADGWLVLDPGGDALGSVKTNAIRDIVEQSGKSIVGALETHGDPDHTSDYEKITGGEVPMYLGRQGWWAAMSPEKFFLAHARNVEKKGAPPDVQEKMKRLTGQKSGELSWQRDIPYRWAAKVLNPRDDFWSSEERHAKKEAIGEQLRDFPPAFQLASGQRLDVISLPGHAPEETGFFLPDEKILFSGDLIETSKPTRSKRANLFMPDANVYDALRSLQHIRELDPETLCPAHGQPIRGQENVRAHVETMIADMESLIERTRSVAADHRDLTVQELRPLVFTPKVHLEGCNSREEETWILSILRDQAEKTESVG